LYRRSPGEGSEREPDRSRHMMRGSCCCCPILNPTLCSIYSFKLLEWGGGPPRCIWSLGATRWPSERVESLVSVCLSVCLSASLSNRAWCAAVRQLAPSTPYAPSTPFLAHRPSPFWHTVGTLGPFDGNMWIRAVERHCLSLGNMWIRSCTSGVWRLVHCVEFGV